MSCAGAWIGSPYLSQSRSSSRGSSAWTFWVQRLLSCWRQISRSFQDAAQSAGVTLRSAVTTAEETVDARLCTWFVLEIAGHGVVLECCCLMWHCPKACMLTFSLHLFPVPEWELAADLQVKSRFSCLCCLPMVRPWSRCFINDVELKKSGWCQLAILLWLGSVRTCTTLIPLDLRTYSPNGCTAPESQTCFERGEDEEVFQALTAPPLSRSASPVSSSSTMRPLSWTLSLITTGLWREREATCSAQAL